MRTRLTLISMPALGATLALALGGGPPGEPEFTADFGLEHCHALVPNGGNLHFSLQPGRFLRLEGDDDGEFVELEITVLPDTQPVTFQVNGQWKTAITRVIEEREWADRELVEVSRNYFARCSKTGNIYYFGEDVDIYKDGKIVSHEGAWLAGRDGALPGLIMPELFLLGSRYFQEIAPDVAMDRAEHVEAGLVVETPAGIFENCVMVVETSPLEPGAESVKIYAPRIGLIFDDGLELVEFQP